MNSTYSFNTGNTSFHSGDGDFSSMSAHWVEVWEKENIRRQYIESSSFGFRFFWDCKGNTERLKAKMSKAKQRGHKFL